MRNRREQKVQAAMNQREPYALFRGIYSRVARQLGVDRSYVSRVARGERRSEEIEAALRIELRRVETAVKALGKHLPASRRGRKLSVLVVDDERTVAHSIAEILSLNGFETRVAYDGRQAIREVLEDCPDAIITDVVMPRVNGIEAAKAIQEMCPDARILLFSGQAATSDLLKTAEQQGYSFELLPKPVHPDVLLSKLSQPAPAPM
ncbi:MAG TPA: response regulator [Terriglobales bacterium]|nr:response regulator [Terriglobales bacterium]